MKTKMLCLISFISFIIGCSKETAWLDHKPDQSLVVPTTLDDLKAILNNENKMNLLDVAMGFISGEPFYVRESNYTSISAGIQRNLYTWANYPYEGGIVSDWNNTYYQVYCCNVVLDGLRKIAITNDNRKAYNELMGTALFFRSYAYYKLLIEFAPLYDSATATSMPGIILSASSDISSVKTRSNLQESYHQVLADLSRADSLLPETVPVTTLPSRTASKALLARIYLSMRDYPRAYLNADKALALNKYLMDFNSLPASASYPIPKTNGEDIFRSRMNIYLIMLYTVTDSILYKSYATNDLRRTLFFNTSSGLPVFKGSYEGGISFYSGLATDELYLIRAECHARAGRATQAMDDLNQLLYKRWKAGTYIDLNAGSVKEALDIILQERQKELLFRGLRWADLKRLNTDPDRAVMLTRTISGQTYMLPPNDLRYVLLLPEAEIAISKIEQNPR